MKGEVFCHPITYEKGEEIPRRLKELLTGSKHVLGIKENSLGWLFGLFLCVGGDKFT